MFIKIPFESEIDFKSNIREITKMSLEHDYNVNDGVVLGNFYISGEYKSHELSVNTEEFKYTLPFTVELRSDIDRESVDFNIEDFSYDIVDNTKLKINIEYSLAGDILEENNPDDELFERVSDEEMNSDLEFMDDAIEDSLVENESEDKNVQEDKVMLEKDRKEEKMVEEEKIEEEVKDIKEDVQEDITEEIIKERLDSENEKTIMDTIKNEDDTFVTYHVHIVKENDTFESISSMYKIPLSLINEYNDLETLNVGDKVLIPLYDE